VPDRALPWEGDGDTADATALVVGKCEFIACSAGCAEPPDVLSQLVQEEHAWLRR
jgi:hypothetical protein